MRLAGFAGLRPGHKLKLAHPNHDPLIPTRILLTGNNRPGCKFENALEKCSSLGDPIGKHQVETVSNTRGSESNGPLGVTIICCVCLIHPRRRPLILESSHDMHKDLFSKDVFTC